MPLYRPKRSKRVQLLDRKDAVLKQAGRLYNKIVIETILRQKPLPPSRDGRHIPLATSRARGDLLTDERSHKPYIGNVIRSSRYTVWDFLPKQLFFQFSKLGNAYFLAIAIMQMIPGLSTTGRWTTLAPLAAFVALSMMKEGYDDYRRYMLDKADNKSEVTVLGPSLKRAGRAWRRARKQAEAGQGNGDMPLEDMGAEPSSVSDDGDWTTVQWQEVKVGDIIRLRRDEAVPADVIILHATNPDSVAYVETMALDGETNLKAKRACPTLAGPCRTMEGLRACDAVIVSEDPNLDLYRYDGRVQLGDETAPLSLSNIVYRGSTIRNTSETIGLVVNTGEECKIRMNAHKHVHAKAPAMQSVANKCILWLVFVVLALSGGLTAGYFIWRDPMEQLSWYLGGTTLSVKEVLIAFIIMFNTLIPLSLYISLEIIKVIQFYLMGDVEMYDPVSNTPMVANTTTILEDLGQVNYVFSDKTGTLTENVMRFRKMSVAGTAWLHDMDVERDEAAKQRLIDMARKKRKGKSKQSSKKHDAASDAGRPSMSSARWKATHNPGDAAAPEPELKTEDLLDYLRRRPNTAFSKKAKHFLLCLALCHTCIPETDEKGRIEYQAASPDEHALVEAARDLGYIMIDRPNQKIILQLPGPDGTTVREEYTVLEVIDFTSKRKRMSIVIRMPDGRICVFCKGADSIIMPRLKLAHVAQEKLSAVEEKARHRRSMEQERQRMSLGSPRNSFALPRPSLSKRPTAKRGDSYRMSMDELRRDSIMVEPSAAWTPREEDEDGDLASPMDMTLRSPLSPRHSMAFSSHEAALDGLVDESAATSESTVFERCFQHIDDFARDGLRTLLYGYRYLGEEEYESWRRIYADASTSIDNRQEKMEAAGELIEEKFDLAGATAIEDKLQEGVPDTIEKLHRASIKVWMLTGDKRETAINIAHSARLCKPYSEVFILDASVGDGRLDEKMATTLTEVARGMLPHTVVVVDGQTLGVIDGDEALSDVFYELAGRVDSVICCRASPSQKANLVKRIRRQVPSSLTLAIGDGSNDIGMIQASHVGVGISGREGLQAARIADYSIAQFRFLQRLLFVHGRWNYLRTGKYILATFWKEVVFFLPQAYYQRLNGYSGTSLYENWSLTVFNSAFTSLPVIFLGGFDRDLSAKTLLEYPELYTFGHRNGAMNLRLYVGWTVIGIVESLIIYYFMQGVYERLPFDQDNSLYAMGTVPFNVIVVFINIKLLALEMHSKTIISLLGATISIFLWYMWNLLLAGAFTPEFRIYQIRRAFIDNFGHTLNFWATCLVILAACIVLELLVSALRRVYFAGDVDLLQRMERKERKEEKQAAKEAKKAAKVEDEGEAEA
ncbi:phospholipid-translocating P-type ATPase [Plectosphaerella cucumerina]|uniref:Phospholipid-transporting ATPase n=1 Tax=Plectosphaerella cucumerina TaxID=40658 RepID=A0A8K0TQD7_9PEZI|nr:phospholipid-translocating P-type ATPase [Plectosphaerella cucumerina]